MVEDLAHQLRSVLHPSELELLNVVAQAARVLDMPVYAVGGMPRDLVLGVASQDVDLVVEGDAIRLGRALVSAHGGSVTVHRRFGTATWHRDAAPPAARILDGVMIGSASVDIATARTETYPHPAQLPHVRAGTIEEDLRRRDFTINAIAIRLDGRHFGQVLDPLNGIDDVRRGLVRVMHDRSFIDDPTRLYRAVRYERRLGFRMDRPTRALMQSAGRWIGVVSGERLRHELDLILMEDRAAEMLKRLSEMGLLKRIHTSLPDDARSLRRLRLLVLPDTEPNPHETDPAPLERRWTLWLMDLSPGAVRSVGRRLTLERRRVELLLAANELRRSASSWVQWRDSRLARKLDGVPELAITTVQMVLPAGGARKKLGHYLGSWRSMRSHSTGQDLRDLGLPPGPRFRAILERLRAAWIDGEVKDLQGELTLLRKLLNRKTSLPRRRSVRPGPGAARNG